MFHIKVWYVHVLFAHLIEHDAKIKPFASKGSLRLGSVRLCCPQSQTSSWRTTEFGVFTLTFSTLGGMGGTCSSPNLADYILLLKSVIRLKVWVWDYILWVRNGCRLTPPIPLCFQCAEIIEFICSILVIHLHFCFELDWNDFFKLRSYFRDIQQISSYCVCHMLAWSAPYPLWAVLYENLSVVPYVS